MTQDSTNQEPGNKRRRYDPEPAQEEDQEPTVEVTPATAAATTPGTAADPQLYAILTHEETGARARRKAERQLRKRQEARDSYFGKLDTYKEMVK